MTEASIVFYYIKDYHFIIGEWVPLEIQKYLEIGYLPVNCLQIYN